MNFTLKLESNTRVLSRVFMTLLLLADAVRMLRRERAKLITKKIQSFHLIDITRYEVVDLGYVQCVSRKMTICGSVKQITIQRHTDQSNIQPQIRSTFGRFQSKTHSIRSLIGFYFYFLFFSANVIRNRKIRQFNDQIEYKYVFYCPPVAVSHFNYLLHDFDLPVDLRSNSCYE